MTRTAIYPGSFDPITHGAASSFRTTIHWLGTPWALGRNFAAPFPSPWAWSEAPPDRGAQSPST
jgi:hypothetical protein